MPAMWGLASATWVMRSPCAVPTSTADLYWPEGEFCCDGHVCAVADAGHGAEKAAEALGVGVERCEGIAFAVADFVLRLAGAEGGGEIAPEGIEAVVGHLEHAADVGGLALVEEEIGGGRVVVGAVAALEEVEGDEGVEEVVARSGDAGGGGR